MSRFFRYQFSALANRLNAWGQGSTFVELSGEDLAALPVVVPSVDVQQAAADYLDRETARIDALIAAKRRMVELLRGRVVAARRDRFLKRSAIGQVPLRRLIVCLDGQRIPLNREERARRVGSYPYWGAGGILDHIDGYLFDGEFVLIGEDGAPFFDESRDVAFRTEGSIWVNNHIHILRCIEGIDARWLCHMLNAVDYRVCITGSTRDKLTQGELMDIRVPQLAEAEQRVMAEELDAIEDCASKLSQAISTQINLLAERRQALITAAVTGQLDIPGAA